MLFALLFTFSSMVFGEDLYVVDSFYPVEDHLGNPTICVTIFEDQQRKLHGVIEDIEDCYLARFTKRGLITSIFRDEYFLVDINHMATQEYLKSLFPEVNFVYSEGY